MNQGGKGMFSKDFISAFNILSTSAMSFFSGPNSLFSIKSKSPANNICVSIRKQNPKICKASECNPWLSFFHILLFTLLNKISFLEIKF